VYPSYHRITILRLDFHEMKCFTTPMRTGKFSNA
jgi:hypothetical protein